ncbi:hypothetical protein AMS68_000824 [Peltaster fructicola]|uniref:Sm domain-containing protein n=1 Tax=Peltaster fructicola TaxID=286661 RepID=A0A6H0XKN7_9PEZI|nr:hypothetical protein AMS68_000824 [Peltaster fructicola]
MTSTIGIPIKLLNETTGHQVTVELISGVMYRGKLIEAEDNMNVQMENCNVTQRDGRVEHLQRVYIRGSNIRLFIIPDMLRNAPMFRAKGAALTGSTASHADIDDVTEPSRTLRIETPYYSATVPIWLDELTDSTEWQREFSQPEAKQVVDAIGAWIFCFTTDETPIHDEQLDASLEAIQAVVDLHTNGSNDAVMLAVAIPRDSTVITEDRLTQLEDITMRYNFELINYAATGLNDFGEKQGLDRIREALEANEWTSSVETGEDDDLDVLDSPGSGEAEIDVDLADLKASLMDKDTTVALNDEVGSEEQANAVDDLELMLDPTMIWTAELLQPRLPDHCVPANDFLLRFSSTFHVCVPTNLAFASNILGILSITAWLSAQLPQIWKNYSLKSTSGLSIYFLLEWCLGDLGNLLGALFTHQAQWQIAIGAYYVFVDFCLVLQWVWYERLKHGRPLFKVRKTGEQRKQGSTDMDEVIIEGVQDRPTEHTERTTPRPIFRTPTFRRDSTAEKDSEASPSASTRNYRVGPSSALPSPSPRTVLLIACLIAMAQASPITTSLVGSMQQDTLAVSHSTSLELAGTILSWMSTVLYLASRIPQIYKNWQRQSTAGLSAHLFLAAFCGNLCYSAAIATNPCAWFDFEPYGGGGWAGADGSRRSEWTAAALPFFLGAAGVLGLDATVGVQFLLYGQSESKVIVVDEEVGLKWRWRRVSGWMRGWTPSINEVRNTEGRRLLEHSDTHGEGYGTLS